jgi:hypothetical protein
MTSTEPAASGRLSKKTKLMLMFGPLLCFLLGLFWLVDELKHPVKTVDQCTVVGTGQAIQAMKARTHLLYAQSDNPQFDIGLQCQQRGTVVINDTNGAEASLASGAEVVLESKAYEHLPTLWALSVKSYK